MSSNLDIPLPQGGLPTLALSVTCLAERNEMHAVVHELGAPERLYAEFHMAVFSWGLAFMENDGRGTAESRERPPDPAGLRSELLRRMRKLAKRFDVQAENWRFFEARGKASAEVSALTLPPSWENARVLRACQEAYDRQESGDRRLEAKRHADEGSRFLEEGRFRKAAKLFRQAREEDPAHYLPPLCLAELALRESRCEEARSLLEEAKKLFKKAAGLTKKQLAQGGARLEFAAEKLRAAAMRGRQALADPAQGSATPASPQQAPAAAPVVPVDWQPPEFPAWLGERFSLGPADPAVGAAEPRVGAADSLERYRLRLDAERLLTLGGFNELLAPSKSHIVIFEHQVRAVRTALRRMRGRALLADEVGLGKTIEAGLALKEYLLRGMASKVLILVPPVLAEQWREELASKFDIEAEVFSPEETPEGSFWRRTRVAVASLALAKREPHRSWVLAQNYDVVIVDEAHHLRRRETLAWRLVNQLKTRSLLLLTATPIQNDLDELYSLATLLRPGQLGTPSQFRARFQQRGEARKLRDSEGLRSLLRELMIRHTRASAAVALPRRVARTVYVPMKEPERAAYDALSGFVRSLGRSAGANPLFLLTLLQREAGSDLRAALPTLRKLAPRLPAEGRASLGDLGAAIEALPEPSKRGALLNILDHTPGKCLIFTEFRETQERLARALAARGETVEVFHGGMTPAQKASALARFEGSSRLLLSSPAGGEGTNLQFCRLLVNYDLPWNPMRIEQRIGRLHRLGQTGEVVIYNLASQDTVEHHLLRILDEKLNLFELVVGEAETILGELTQDKEFEQILMETWLEAADSREAAERLERLGELIVREKENYLEIKKLDEALFGADYEAA